MKSDKATGLLDPQFDAAALFDGLQSVDDQIQQGLGQLSGIRHERRQVLGQTQHDLDLPGGGFRTQQFADMLDRFRNVDEFQIQLGRAGQPEELLDDVFQAMQFAVDDFQAAEQPIANFRSLPGQVFLQQLHVDVQGAKRVPNLMRQARQQARQQVLLFGSGKLRHILAKRLGKNFFHGAKTYGFRFPSRFFQ